jgi:hypothetical protein
VSRWHGAALAAVAVAAALLLISEASLLPSAWLPVEEAATMQSARGGASAPSAGVLLPVLLAPAARTLSPSAAYDAARALSGALWALAAAPAYVLARRLLRPGASLLVAAFAAVVPASVYATAATPDALAYLLAVSSLAVFGRGRLLAAVALAMAAALARPWFAPLPVALLVADAVVRGTWRAALRWPRPLALGAFCGVAYVVVAETAPAAEVAFTAPDATARAALAGLVAAAVGAGVAPWLLAAGGRGTEAALLAVCLPALALSAGVVGAAAPGRGMDERPLLVLVPLVLALAAATGERAPPRVVAVAGLAVALAALALPALGRAPAARAAGLSVLAPDGASRASLVAGVWVATVVALLLLHLVRRRPVVLAGMLTVALLAGQAAAWSGARAEARALEGAELIPRGWVDRHAGQGAEVVVAGPAEALDARTVANVALWNRTIRGTQQLDLSNVDPLSGQWGARPEAGLILVRGTDLAGTVLARSQAGVLMRPELAYRLAETVEGVGPDGWSGEQAVYRRFSGTGSLLVAVGRPEGGAADVRISSGPLDEESDRLRARFALQPGQRREVVLELPEPRYRVVVSVSPTFAASDGRQLGTKVRFEYRPLR